MLERSRQSIREGKAMSSDDFWQTIEKRHQKSSQSAMTTAPVLDYHATAFSQGRMDFAWEELSEEERRQAYAEYAAGKGLLGGDPRFRPGSHLLPDWGIDLPFFRALTLDDERGNNGDCLRNDLISDRPLEIEIGFGRGDFLFDRARRHPDTLFIGYEVNTGATRRMLNRICGGGNDREVGKSEDGEGEQSPISNLQSPLSPQSKIQNLWLSDDDCRFSLPRVIADGRADAVHILFPDPWWKEQHKIRRLFSPPFVDLLASKLRPGGLLHFKSDVLDYGELVRYLVEQHPAFLPHDPTLAARIGDFAPTHREHWCIRSGKAVAAWYFLRREA